ncbi:hypothetical protein Vretimale_7325 [Volvox reticuliferus]|uniref:Peptidase C1A papain C-terminal domain-containing protein n=1 Tax=Volvox reticuliferus TaxID=1737510 RepID=A0A8J4FVB0_9CHLO|nr:hypothetical protein Vretifemale_19397 [Volvox reticuliferus]GIM02477.1 hypothetical protein Vretimale_7325 [Volvox reticuliferus]
MLAMRTGKSRFIAILSAAVLIVATSAKTSCNSDNVSPPRWPSSYEVEYLETYPSTSSYLPASVSIPGHAWISNWTRIRLDMGPNSAVVDLKQNVSWTVTPVFRAKTCQLSDLHVNNTRVYSVLPILSLWTYAGKAVMRDPSARSSRRSVDAFVWKMTSTSLPGEGAGTNLVDHFYTAQEDGRPLRWTSVVNGRESIIDYTSWVPGPVDEDVFYWPPECVKASMDWEAFEASGNKPNNASSPNLKPFVSFYTPETGDTASTSEAVAILGGLPAAPGIPIAPVAPSSPPEMPPTPPAAAPWYESDSSIASFSVLGTLVLYKGYQYTMSACAKIPACADFLSGGGPVKPTYTYGDEPLSSAMKTLQAQQSQLSTDIIPEEDPSLEEDLPSENVDNLENPVANDNGGNVDPSDDAADDAGDDLGDVLTDIHVGSALSSYIPYFPTQTYFGNNGTGRNVTVRDAAITVNTRLIHTSNLASSSGHGSVYPTFTMGPNAFSSMHFVEWLTKSVGSRPSAPSNVSLYQRMLSDAQLPAHLDYRGTPMDGPGVKDQTACRGCWAFTAAGVLSGAWAKATGTPLSFSEQQLLDCDWGNGNLGCSEGDPVSALLYAVNGPGVVEEGEYPFQGFNGYCRLTSSMSRKRFSRVGMVRSGDDKAVMEALVRYGPLAVVIQAPPSLQFYKSGVFFDKTYCTAKLTTSQIYHSVVLMGYGTTKEGVDYWIIKNSWGTSWGLNGYGLIARSSNGVNDCGLTQYVAFIA